MIDKFGIKRFPTYIIIDKNGTAIEIDVPKNLDIFKKYSLKEVAAL